MILLCSVLAAGPASHLWPDLSRSHIGPQHWHSSVHSGAEDVGGAPGWGCWWCGACEAGAACGAVVPSCLARHPWQKLQMSHCGHLETGNVQLLLETWYIHVQKQPA